MSLFATFSSCFGCTEDVETKSGYRTVEEASDDFVRVLFEAEKPGQEIKRRWDDMVGVYGWDWQQNVAKSVLRRIVIAIQEGRVMGVAMKEAAEKSFAQAREFANKHPAYTTIIALGILVVLAPWLIEWLGFGEAGPIAETFAAWWQSTYGGYVERGSLFCFFQRLGMVWRRYIK